MRYRERLYPSGGMLLALSLSFPMVLLAALPFGVDIGLWFASIALVATHSLFLLTSPTIEITKQELRVSRFRIPLTALKDPIALNQVELKDLIGPGADARAQLLIRGYVKTGVKIEISDEKDPTPYIVISTRNPKELAVALLANRS